MIVDLASIRQERKSDAFVHRMRSWEGPLLPGMSPNTVRRWQGLPTWMPPETQVLCRHRALGGEHRMHTNSRQPAPGYELEFDLGFVQRHAAPGAERLVTDEARFWIDEQENDVPDGVEALGFVEQVPLPMLDVLEIRALPETGQHVLVSGVADPLYGHATPVGAVGWIEALPIQPRRAVDHHGWWGLRTLVRVSDRDRWRHTYLIEPGERPAGAVVLGGLNHAPAPGFVALHAGADGRLSTELLAPSASAPAGWRETAHWVGAPLGWSRRPQAWALRATASRARRLALQARGSATGSAGGEPLGWLRAEAAPGWSPLYSATHPTLRDQFLTRSELEARDLGFGVDGVLGHIADAGADRQAHEQPREILWGSRFGRARRYIEGPVPGR